MQWRHVRVWIILLGMANLFLWFIDTRLVLWAIPYILIVGIFDIIEDKRK